MLPDLSSPIKFMITSYKKCSANHASEQWAFIDNTYRGRCNVGHTKVVFSPLIWAKVGFDTLFKAPPGLQWMYSLFLRSLFSIYVSHRALYWQHLTTLVNIRIRLQAYQLNTLNELSHSLMGCIQGIKLLHEVKLGVFNHMLTCSEEITLCECTLNGLLVLGSKTP